MGNIKLVNRVRSPLSTIRLARANEGEMNPEQVANLFRFTNHLTGKPFMIKDMDELFYECSACFDSEKDDDIRKLNTYQLCNAMGYDPSTENLLKIRDRAEKYISHKYFNSEDYVNMLRKTSLPIMDARENVMLSI